MQRVGYQSKAAERLYTCSHGYTTHCLHYSAIGSCYWGRCPQSHTISTPLESGCKWLVALVSINWDDTTSGFLRTPRYYLIWAQVGQDTSDTSTSAQHILPNTCTATHNHFLCKSLLYKKYRTSLATGIASVNIAVRAVKFILSLCNTAMNEWQQ